MVKCKRCGKAFQIVFAGWIFVLFYVVSGTIWISMALHAALDAAQGRLGYRLLSDAKWDHADTPDEIRDQSHPTTTAIEVDAARAGVPSGVEA